MKIVSFLWVMLVCLSINAFASSQGEIEHLLSYVSKTDCKYERNGSLYSGAKAVEHIHKKYEYFKDDISTTEEFIEYSATKSTMSGKFYRIHCGEGEPIRSQDWLLEELERYRSKDRASTE